MKKYKVPKVLTIAGSDSSGGAGIQADIKTIQALGCYAMSVVTALTAQNTLGVSSVFAIPPDVVKAQLETTVSDIRPDCIKIGMLADAEIIHIIAELLKQNRDIPVILDPVMIATSGDRLLPQEAVTALIDELFPLALLTTPNMDEAGFLTGMTVTTEEEMLVAGGKLVSQHAHAVLVKGGHLKKENLTSFLFMGKEVESFSSKKIDTSNVHGSGCTLSSAIASYIALGENLSSAINLASDYVHRAIIESQNVLIGSGNGPLNHTFNPQKLRKYEMD
jgi:hydroxymethylpyrimidine/phosphomethylpyrimidine kinase